MSLACALQDRNQPSPWNCLSSVSLPRSLDGGTPRILSLHRPKATTVVTSPSLFAKHSGIDAISDDFVVALKYFVPMSVSQALLRPQLSRIHVCVAPLQILRRSSSRRRVRVDLWSARQRKMLQEHKIHVAHHQQSSRASFCRALTGPVTKQLLVQELTASRSSNAPSTRRSKTSCLPPCVRRPVNAVTYYPPSALPLLRTRLCTCPAST